MRKSEDISHNIPTPKRFGKDTDEAKWDLDEGTTIRDRLLAEAQANRRLFSSLIDSDWLGLELLAEIGTSSSSVNIQELERETDIVPTLNRLVEAGLLEEQYGKYCCSKIGREILTKTEKLTGVSMNR